MRVVFALVWKVLIQGVFHVLEHRFQQTVLSVSYLHSAVCARVLVRARRGGGVFLKGWVTSQMGGFARGPDGAEQ